MKINNLAFSLILKFYSSTAADASEFSPLPKGLSPGNKVASSSSRNFSRPPTIVENNVAELVEAGDETLDPITPAFPRKFSMPLIVEANVVELAEVGDKTLDPIKLSYSKKKRLELTDLFCLPPKIHLASLSMFATVALIIRF